MCRLFKLEQLIALETGKREEVQHHFKTMKIMATKGRISRLLTH